MAFVQKATQTTTTIANPSVAFSSSNTAGNCIIVDVLGSEVFGGHGTWTPSDSQGNTYTQIGTRPLVNNYSAWQFVALNIAAGANTVTVTYSDPGALISYLTTFAIQEYSGVLTALAVDDHDQTSGSVTSALSKTITASATDLIHVFASCNVGGSTMTEILSATSNVYYSANGVVQTWDVVHSSGSVAETVTFSTSEANAFLYMLALKGSFGPGSSALFLSPSLDGLGKYGQLKGGCNG